MPSKSKTNSISHQIRNRIYGCLVGVAVGDALGAPFEHLWPGTSSPMLDKTGGKVLDFFPYMNYRAGSWTDDTGLTLATCRGFIHMEKMNRSFTESFSWAHDSWLCGPGFRKPGRTVLYAAKYGKPDIQSWANGALMRISPVAMYSALRGLDTKESGNLAYRVARLTHGHPFATFPAVECVLAISSILADEKRVPAGLSDPEAHCHLSQEDPHARYHLYQEKRHGVLEALHPSTGLWMWRHIFERVLGLSEGCSWSQMPDFEEGMIKAVNESFDRDTAGAVAGALLGAYWGEDHIPDRWKDGVEDYEGIKALADEFITVLSPHAGTVNNAFES